MNITRGKVPSAVKVVVYGPEGIGKSTFASKFPNAIFCDTEGSTKHMDVARMPEPLNFSQIIEYAQYFIQHPEEIGTFVLDTADWADTLCQQEICIEKKCKSIEDIGYGKGYTMAAEKFTELLKTLDVLSQCGVNVVLTAHAQMRKFEQPDEIGAYDRWELKTSKKTAPLIKEWADMLLFVNYKTDIIKSKEGTNKATGGKRIMYTSHHPVWDAKNRFGLESELPFEYETIAKFVPENLEKKAGTYVKSEPAKEQKKSEPKKTEEKGPVPKINIGEMTEVPQKPMSMTSDDPDKDKLLTKVWAQMSFSHVTVEQLQSVIAKKGYYSADVEPKNYEENFILGCLITAWLKVLAEIQVETGSTPF